MRDSARLSGSVQLALSSSDHRSVLPRCPSTTFAFPARLRKDDERKDALSNDRDGERGVLAFSSSSHVLCLSLAAPPKEQARKNRSSSCDESDVCC
jgi:hypothetical protein